MRHCTWGISLLACAMMVPTSVHAQWSAAPTVAVGPVVPSTGLRGDAREGIAVKAGVWFRAPKVPIGLTAEGLFVHLPRDRSRPTASGVDIVGLGFNATTRRHQRRLETYATAGLGGYRVSGGAVVRDSDVAVGVNAGIGEIIAVGSMDYFIEIRAHAMRLSTPTGDRWTSFVPLVLGARF